MGSVAQALHPYEGNQQPTAGDTETTASAKRNTVQRITQAKRVRHHNVAQQQVTTRTSHHEADEKSGCSAGRAACTLWNIGHGFDSFVYI